MTAREALSLAARSVARRDAQSLLLHILGRDRPWLLAHPETQLLPNQTDSLAALTARRARHEPLQYLLGHQEFYGLDLRVTPDVLIPRPETELLVEAVLHWAKRQASPIEHPEPLQILDVGTGSGAIALALAAHLSHVTLTAVDLSSAALGVAQKNADRLDLGSRVRFLLSDLLNNAELHPPQAAPWDVIVSNPPYVPDVDAATLQPEVRDFEPHTALFAGTDGLTIYRRLLPQAFAALRSGGLLALEFGFGQQTALAALLNSWREVRFFDDLAGIPRVALATRP